MVPCILRTHRGRRQWSIGVVACIDVGAVVDRHSSVAVLAGGAGASYSQLVVSVSRRNARRPRRRAAAIVTPLAEASYSCADAGCMQPSSTTPSLSTSVSTLARIKLEVGRVCSLGTRCGRHFSDNEWRTLSIGAAPADPWILVHIPDQASLPSGDELHQRPMLGDTGEAVEVAVVAPSAQAQIRSRIGAIACRPVPSESISRPFPQCHQTLGT